VDSLTLKCVPDRWLVPSETVDMLPKLEKVTQPEDTSFHLHVRNSRTFQYFWHRHPEYELTLIQQGRGRRFVGDSIADYGDGDLVLVGSNLPHTWSCETMPRSRRHQAVVAHFTPDFLGPGLFNQREFKSIGALLERSNRGLQFHEPTREAIGRRLGALADREPFERVLELLAILHELARSRSARPLASAGYRYTPTSNNPSPRHIDKICEYIHQHFTDGVGEAEVARYAHMSPSAFSRSFRKLTGRTFKNYLNELRVGRACHLLRETERPIMQICLDSGFANLSNFNRRFVALKNVTPRDYRKVFAGQSNQVR
jgi:AraC-like DNA-binding protein